MSNFQIILIHKKSCFIALPQDLVNSILDKENVNLFPLIVIIFFMIDHSKEIEMPLILEMIWDDWSFGNEEKKKIIVGWDGSISSELNTIEISSHFAKVLNLKHHQKVSIKPLKKLKYATQVELEPLSENDWELIVIIIWNFSNPIPLFFFKCFIKGKKW